MIFGTLKCRFVLKTLVNSNLIKFTTQSVESQQCGFKIAAFCF